MSKSASYDSVAGLSVHPLLRNFVEGEVLPAARLDAKAFWEGLAAIIAELAPRHRELLAIRDTMQAQIDDWHRARKGEAHDPVQYEAFLREIGYLVPEPAPDAYQVATKNVDAEIGTIAAPQLVVPLSNARYALNAANARWGSLYDALYGTDALPEDNGATRSGPFNPVRAQRVIADVRAFEQQPVDCAGGPLTIGERAGFVGVRAEPASGTCEALALALRQPQPRRHRFGNRRRRWQQRSQPSQRIGRDPGGSFARDQPFERVELALRGFGQDHLQHSARVHPDDGGCGIG